MEDGDVTSPLIWVVGLTTTTNTVTNTDANWRRIGV